MIVYFADPTHSFDSIDWVSFGGYLLNTVMIAITVVVVAVPEGLPMSVTLSLAYSMRSMNGYQQPRAQDARLRDYWGLLQ